MPIIKNTDSKEKYEMDHNSKPRYHVYYKFVRTLSYIQTGQQVLKVEFQYKAVQLNADTSETPLFADTVVLPERSFPIADLDLEIRKRLSNDVNIYVGYSEVNKL